LKVRGDEHVSLEIVRAVRAMALTHGWEFSSVVEVGDRGSKDEHWITKFASEGGHAIISGDTDFLKRPHQVLAVNRTGMRVIHMPPKWSNARCDLQAAHTLLWWRRIERTIAAMNPRECYRPPWNATEDGELAKLKVDYQDADKWEKRREKRDEQAARDTSKAKDAPETSKAR
jgi:PIN like domain